MRPLSGLVAIMLLAATSAVSAKSLCGDLRNGYGPFDYRTKSQFPDNFQIVEGAHFTDDVRNGVGGATGSIGGDLDYTLRAIPNHPQALNVMGQVGLKTKQAKLPGAKFPVECYFERAIRFQPNDGSAYATYGSYLLSAGRNPEAVKMFQTAVDLMPEDATINYNTGLVYFRVKDYDKANRYAQKAYGLGFPLPGLKNMLVSAGKWNDKPQ